MNTGTRKAAQHETKTTRENENLKVGRDRRTPRCRHLWSRRKIDGVDGREGARRRRSRRRVGGRRSRRRGGRARCNCTRCPCGRRRACARVREIRVRRARAAERPLLLELRRDLLPEGGAPVPGHRAVGAAGAGLLLGLALLGLGQLREQRCLRHAEGLAHATHEHLDKFNIPTSECEEPPPPKRSPCIPGASIPGRFKWQTLSNLQHV